METKLTQLSVFINDLGKLVVQNQLENLFEIDPGNVIALGFGRDDEIGLVYIGFGKEPGTVMLGDYPDTWEVKGDNRFLTVIIPGGEDELKMEVQPSTALGKPKGTV